MEWLGQFIVMAILVAIGIWVSVTALLVVVHLWRGCYLLIKADPPRWLDRFCKWVGPSR
jgi:hypothetical protein